jgi:hypothetical protein
MLLSGLSIIVSGIIEIYRKEEIAASGGFEQELAGDVFLSSHISIWSQMSVFALLAAGEVTCDVTRE